jgi:hypothetical protein
MKRLIQGAVAASLAACSVNTATASCGSAFCFVNTNWSLQGIWTEPGPHVDIRFEYLDQDQPRSGTNDVSVGEIPAHHDEIKTVNKNTILTLDYGFSPEWGVTAVLPIVDRDHEHIHNHMGQTLLDQWSFTDLGDVRIQGRYQTLWGQTTAERAGFAGITFGLTLPTGKTNVANGEGDVAERSLQPGTGTTQLALSAYYREALPMHNSSWYAQVAGLIPLGYHENYKPGTQVGADLDYRYDVSDNLGLNLQLNYVYKGRDKGSEAEPEDPGGHALFIAPGVTYSFTPAVQIYGFAQLPIYRYVNGVQLTAKWAGLSGSARSFRIQASLTSRSIAHNRQL